MAERCDQCKFFVAHKDEFQRHHHPDDKEGVCRRLPPVFDPQFDRIQTEGDDAAENSSYWMSPVVAAAHWCGEWRSQSVAAKVEEDSIGSERRDVVDTETAARYMNRRPQTLRGWASKDDGPFRPSRVHGRLVWSMAEIRKLMLGGE